MHSKLSFALLFLSHGASSALTINGQDITTILKPGENVLIWENNTVDNAYFSMTDGAIKIGALVKKNDQAIIDFYNELDGMKEKLYTNISKDTINMQSLAAIEVDGAYMCADNRIILNAGTTLEINDSILKANEVVFLFQDLKLKRCFIDAETLYLESNSPKSVCEVIRFTFNKELPLPAMADGQINFECNDASKGFVVVGAQKVEIQLAPHAFDVSAQ